MADITPITGMVDITEDTGEDITPITEVPTGLDTTMDIITAIITVTMGTTIMVGPTIVMAKWIAGNLMGIQDLPM